MIREIVPPQLPVPDITAGDLMGLLRFVLRRMWWELRATHSADESINPALSLRVQSALRGVSTTGFPITNEADLAAMLAATEADLRELTTVPTALLRRVYSHGAVSARCHAPLDERAIYHQQQAAALRTMQDLQRPRVSPAELVQRFAAAGVTIRAVGAELHVSPSGMLTPGDRELLRQFKAEIIAVLAVPADIV